MSAQAALTFLQSVIADAAEVDDPLLADHGAAVARTGSRYALAMRSVALGTVACRAGRTSWARPHLERALDLAYEIGDPALETLAIEGLTDLEVGQGHTDVARAIVAASTERMRSSAPGRAEVIQVKQATFSLVEGDAVRAQAELTDVLAVVRSFALPYWVAIVLTRLAHAERLLGDLPSARHHLVEALAVARTSRMPWRTALVLAQLGQVARAENELKQAEQLHHEALEIAEAHGLWPLVADGLEALGGLAACSESCEEAARLLGAAQRLRDEMQWPREPVAQPAYEHDRSRISDALDEERFTRAWDEGWELARADAVAYVRRARGERTRPSAGWDSLTPTELRVVALAAGGRTNAEIGRALFISPATAKTHMAHIFTKLGLSNRAQLAAAATARGHSDESPGRWM